MVCTSLPVAFLAGELEQVRVEQNVVRRAGRRVDQALEADEVTAAGDALERAEDELFVVRQSE
jgi:hypothetical protein